MGLCAVVMAARHQQEVCGEVAAADHGCQRGVGVLAGAIGGSSRLNGMLGNAGVNTR